MNGFPLSSRSHVLVAALLLVATAGCVKKPPTSVDAAYAPEGRFDPEARLVVYASTPNTFRVMADLGLFGPSADDTLLRTEPFSGFPMGTVQMMLMDGTGASAFEAYRRETSGGYLALKDYPLRPVRKWLDGESELFVTRDEHPSGFQPASYLMRGLVAGEVTTLSPLSNVGMVVGGTIQGITYRGVTSTADSLLDIRWDPIAGAAGYWIDVYQFLEASLSDKMLSGLPAPMYVGKSREYFLGFVPAPATSYKLGQADGGVKVFTRRPTFRGQEYLVRIAAVDANGALIALTTGGTPQLDAARGRWTASGGDFDLAAGDGEYTLYPLGAKIIEVRSATP
jgi:hypothetical protein